MTCITIASWMLAVVGAAIVGISSYCVHKYLTDDDDMLIFACSIISTIGIIMIISGVVPYIQEIAWPCIQIIP